VHPGLSHGLMLDASSTSNKAPCCQLIKIHVYFFVHLE